MVDYPFVCGNCLLRFRPTVESPNALCGSGVRQAEQPKVAQRRLTQVDVDHVNLFVPNMSPIDSPAIAGGRSPQRIVEGVLESVKRHANIHHLVLLTVPWLLFLINANWPYQALNPFDPWYYFGHFIHFPHYQQLNPTYAGERLPWLIPGILLNRIFQPAYAELALHVCCYWIALFSLYYLLRRLTNDNTALLGSILMGSHPMFIGANGSTYLEGGCIVYLLLTFVCLTRSRSASVPDAWLIAAGACWAGLAYTYIFWIVLTPCCLIFYLSISADSEIPGRRLLGVSPTRLLAATGHFLVGGLLITAVLQSIHMAVHGAGHGFFFLYNIAFPVSLGASNPFAEHGYGWVSSNGSLVFPSIALGVCIASIVLHYSGLRPLVRSSLGVIWTYIYGFLILVFFTVYRAGILQSSCHESVLIPLVFLALGVTALPAPKHLPSGQFATVLGLGFFISTLSLWKAGLYLNGLSDRLWVHYLVAMIGAMLPLLSARRWVWVASVACLSGASFGLVPEWPSAAWTTNYNGLSASIRIGDATKRIEAFLPYDKYPIFWIDAFSSPYSLEYRAIMCAFVAHGVSMWRYPKIGVGASAAPAQYLPGTQIILISQRRDTFEQARSAMAEVGMPLRLTGQQLVSRDNVSYWLTFTEIVNPAEEAGAVNETIRLPIAEGLQSSSEKATLERVGQSWRVITSPQQWAYAAAIPLPAIQSGRRRTIRIRGHVVRGKVGFGLLNRSGQYSMEQFVDGPAQTTEISLPAESTDDVATLMIRNGGSDGPSEVVLDSIDIAVAARKAIGLGNDGRITARSAGVSASSGRPTTIVWAGAGSDTASVPLFLNQRANGAFYLEVKAQVRAGKINVEVLDHNKKDNQESRVLGGGTAEDVFIRVPAGLKDGEFSFHAVGAGAGAKIIVSDLVLWEII
uniref:Uncharacterized protein n=1 Tax=Solibacter usitatus (strain Ellin6076) TaxID=234267 RepID=Q02BA3_SOLUE